MKRTVEDYERRLTDRTAKWISDHPGEVERIQRSIIGPEKPLPIPGSWLREFLDTMVAQEIRREQGWPTCSQWRNEKPPMVDHKRAAANDDAN